MNTTNTPKQKDTASPSLASRIRSCYDSLPVSEKRIADLILDFPGEVAAYSATELAKLSGGSKAAMTRLVKRLGFANFEEARRAAREAQAWGSPLFLLSKKYSENDFHTRVSEHIKQDSHNISITMESINPKVFDRIVSAICTSKRVFIIGYRNSYHLASYLRGQIIQVRNEVYLLPGAGETIAEEIANLTKHDLVVVIGFRRRVAGVHKIISVAQSEKAKVLYITDWSARPEAGATWTIPCAVSSGDVYDRYAAAMSLLHFLSVSVVTALSSQGRNRLKRIESLHEKMHELE